MKINTLIIAGLLTIAFGLQSFISAPEADKQETSLEVVSSSWAATDVEMEATLNLRASDWYMLNCTTSEGIPGTYCGWTTYNGFPCSGPPAHTEQRRHCNPLY